MNLYSRYTRALTFRILSGSYLRYLYAMQHKDYPAAEAHLHRYFDYGMFGRALRSYRADVKDLPVFQWYVCVCLRVYVCV